MEDARIAPAQLRLRGFALDRGTHAEVEIAALWVSSPADWHTHALGRRMGAHWGRVRNALAKPITDAIEDLDLSAMRARVCLVGL
eukprot:4085723-Pyramimonas_sp.AAC.1